MLHGFLNINKPSGMTSHDVVARVRRLAGQRRVGHAGTLDPLAEGVLPLALGRATRLIDRIGGAAKTYYARVTVGASTTTDDAEGDVLREVPVPAFSTADLEAELRPFRGEIEQVPPAFSAIKVHGQRAYAAARRGEALALAPRRVTVYQLDLLEWRSPGAVLLVRCSAGTYIRSLARDLGERLGVGAHLSRLVRLSVGEFDLSRAVDLEELESRVLDGGWPHVILPADLVLLDCPAAVVAENRSEDFRLGRSWPATPEAGQAPAGVIRAYTDAGRLLGLMDYDSNAGRWRPRVSLVD